ncbi:hypothetical protein OH807_30380 [Kitasatospora sp. NBC_01560]|uniref:hypothetical protein n=1 Tax=Kitasatospora sp. NBC_01560 TaxID=2975965 RepID=UPI003867F97B
MVQLAERLSALAGSGQPISFSAVALPLETVVDEVAEVAAGPFAPFLAEAIVHAYDLNDGRWEAAAGNFPAGLASQRSLLQLTSVVETLLASSATTQAMAKPLNRVLLDDFPQAVQTAPLLAAARLEGAVRLAVSKAVSPHKVMDTIEELPTDSPEDFLDRLPRILGVALDCWSADTTVASTLRTILERLSHDEAADVDALFELGCDRLRSALTSRDLANVIAELTSARTYFATAAAAEEARHDAEAYTAVCDAVLGFTAADAGKVSSAADRIERALEQRTAWLLGTHQPAWLQPRLAAEVGWAKLLLQLRAAAEHLQQPVWMNSWEALDTVLSVYSAARTVRPVGGDNEGMEGLAALVEPAIEDGFLRQQSFLAALRRAAERPEEHPGGGFDEATASIILARVDARVPSSEPGVPRSSTTEDDSDEDPGGAERLYRIAPTLVQTLGFDGASEFSAGLSDTALATAEGLAYNSDVGRLKASDPLIVPLLTKILRELSAFPAFIGDVRHTFSALVEETLLFLKSRADLSRSGLFGPGKKDDPPYDYRRKPERGQRKAVEGDLQRDFHHWLEHGKLHASVSVEPVNVAMGRADVLVQFGSLRYLTEIKQDPDDNSREHIEDAYLTQAAEYSNTNAPFGQLLVLDLTPKTSTSGTRRIDELVWTTKHLPAGAITDRAVVAGIVTGNRITPSAYTH